LAMRLKMRNGICKGVANWIRRSFAMRVSNTPVAWGTNCWAEMIMWDVEMTTPPGILVNTI
jgi:hypothetical protein